MSSTLNERAFAALIVSSYIWQAPNFFIVSRCQNSRQAGQITPHFPSLATVVFSLIASQMRMNKSVYSAVHWGSKQQAHSGGETSLRLLRMWLRHCGGLPTQKFPHGTPPHPVPRCILTLNMTCHTEMSASITLRGGTAPNAVFSCRGIDCIMKVENIAACVLH